MSNSTAIQKFEFQAPEAFGSNEEINGIIERMAALLPVQLDTYQLGKPEIVKALNNAYLKAAQLCVFYRLVPSQDVHLIPFGNQFAVDTGVEAWKKAADRYCARAGISFHVAYEELSEKELKERRGADYTAEDVGYRAFLWRSDKQQVYEYFGGKDAMTQGVGVWAKKARYNKAKNVWEADTVPSQRSPADVAKRRALKAVLKAEFSLDSLLAAAPNEIAEQLRYLDQDAKRVVQDATPMPAPGSRYTITEQGFVEDAQAGPDEDFYAPEPDLVDNPYADLFDQEPADIEDGEYREPIEEPIDPELVAQYHQIATKLTGDALILCDWSRQQHADSDGTSHLTDYRILAGELDKLVGKHNHNLLLGVLLGRETHSDNRPGERFVRFLLHFLRQELPRLGEDGKSLKDAKGKVIKDPNPGYRESFAKAIEIAWEQINTIIVTS